MTVIWTEEAIVDLTEIVDHLNRKSLDAGRRVATHIIDTIMRLPLLPHRGRKREEDDGREIFFTPLPYICVYQVAGDRLYVQAIRHASRDWAH